jgi:endonuclease III related protein
MILMKEKPHLRQMYDSLLKKYHTQGWWPIINNKTLLCEYSTNAPRNESEGLEICFGAILTQGTQWYPNIVRALQQLKLGRPFKPEELKLIQLAELIHHQNFAHKGIKIDNPNNKNKNEDLNKYELPKVDISEVRKEKICSLILTDNTSWKNVEKAVSQLNKNQLIDITKILDADNKKLAEIIKPSGYYNQKAKKLRNFSLFLIENYYGSLKLFFKNDIVKLREELLSVNGIGPETADSIILYAAQKPIFVIDAYTRRIMGRIGFKEESYEDLQRLFMDNLELDERLFNEYHALLVELGKNTCKKTPLCDKCPLNKNCNYYLSKSTYLNNKN